MSETIGYNPNEVHTKVIFESMRENLANSPVEVQQAVKERYFFKQSQNGRFKKLG
ncbi:MAG TPA: hypothetical protein PK370_01270 [Candidatus Woesebacteria bacterium]|nr:hypothetical protein [Candidatus Woesebacteria bacterium]HPJ17223.1 hypothetical protein [Candidatus Woesebacteria bacterium]